MILIRLKDFVQNMSLGSTSDTPPEVRFIRSDMLSPEYKPFGDGSSFLAVHDPDGFDQFLRSYNGGRYIRDMTHWYSRNINNSHYVVVRYDYKDNAVYFGTHYANGGRIVGGHHMSNDDRTWSSHT